MDKIESVVTLQNHFSYDSNYGIMHIYLFSDSSNSVFCWKTSTKMETSKGDVIRISASVKGVEEYKGAAQTVIQRVKVLETISKYTEVKSAAQLESLNENDFVWSSMPYSQYKNHYSDCETVAGSYNSKYKTIDVIIRDGRLKNSGTRGKHYWGYEFKLSDGGKICFRAVSEENAKKQLLKMYPEETEAECVKIYRY